MPSIVGLIPARAGSKRIAAKNGRILRGHPLLAYTISAALDSGIFERVIVSTNSRQYQQIAHVYGAEVSWRPDEMAGDFSPDFDWLEWTLTENRQLGIEWDAFAILRPTAPFRTAETIRRAWQRFQDAQPCDSIRAVELCKQHPDKMWVIWDDEIRAYKQDEGDFGGPLRWQDWKDENKRKHQQPVHSVPYQALDKVYAQNASLEIAWKSVIRQTKTISGFCVKPFFTEDREGFDLNTEDDWLLMETLIEKGLAELPRVREPKV